MRQPAFLIRAALSIVFLFFFSVLSAQNQTWQNPSSAPKPQQQQHYLAQMQNSRRAHKRKRPPLTHLVWVFSDYVGKTNDHDGLADPAPPPKAQPVPLPPNLPAVAAAAAAQAKGKK